MRNPVTIAGSVLAAGIGTAIFLRPKPIARDQPPASSYLPAAAIFDEPGLARPAAGDDLYGQLPERFFVLHTSFAHGRAAWSRPASTTTAPP